MTAPSSVMVEDLITRFSAYTPTNMYNSLDEYSRELLLYLANDLVLCILTTELGNGLGNFSNINGYKISVYTINVFCLIKCM